MIDTTFNMSLSMIQAKCSRSAENQVRICFDYTAHDSVTLKGKVSGSETVQKSLTQAVQSQKFLETMEEFETV